MGSIHGVPEAVWNAYTAQGRTWGRAAFEKLFGREVPPDLAWWQPSWIDIPAPEKLVRHGNSFEALLDQGNRTVLLQVFTHVHFLACRALEGDGDYLAAHVPIDPERPCEVAIWSHEKQELGEPVTFDLATWSWVETTAYELIEGAIDVEAAARRLALVEGTWSLTWPFNRLFGEVDEDALWRRVAKLRSRGRRGKRPSSDLSRFQWRARWIVELLSGGAFSAAHADPAQAQDRPDAALAERELARYPPAALYWLWRCFFFREERALAKLLERVEDSPSRLVRDAAKLVGEVRDGRKQVGRIEDIHALRDEWHEILTSKAARARRVRADEEESARRAAEDEAAEHDEERAAYAKQLARILRGKSGLVIVGGDGAPELPEPGSDRDYGGRPPPRLDREQDFWASTPAGHQLVIRRDLEIMVCTDGALHAFRPPVRGHAHERHVSPDGRRALVFVDDKIVELDLDRRTSRAILEPESQPNAIVCTEPGFALQYSDRVVLFRLGDDAPVEYATLEVETQGANVLHAGRVLVLVTPSEGAIFLALAGERLHPIGRLALDVYSVYEHEGKPYLRAAMPERNEIHGLAEAHRAALKRPAIRKLGRLPAIRPHMIM